jgi:hypothetical protein
MVEFARVGSGVDGDGVTGVFGDDGVEDGVLNGEGDQMVGMASLFVSSAGVGARPEQCGLGVPPASGSCCSGTLVEEKKGQGDTKKIGREDGGDRESRGR